MSPWYIWVIRNNLGVVIEKHNVPPQWVYPVVTGKGERLIDYYELRPFGSRARAIRVPVEEIASVTPLVVMALTPDMHAQTWLKCKVCGWFGKGEKAICQPEDVVRCPKCTQPVERMEEVKP